jgi:hypothetical protein
MLSERDLIRFKKYVEEDLIEKQRLLPLFRQKNINMARLVQYQIDDMMALLFRIEKELGRI